MNFNRAGGTKACRAVPKGKRAAVKIAWFDCASGISGDMFLGALVDAGLEPARLSQSVEALGVKGLRIEAEKVRRLGMAATKIHVIAPNEHEHRHLSDITALIDASSLPESVKARSIRIFTRLAEAEAAAHGEPIEKVHFHEVGALDSIADIAGAAAGVELLDIKRCYFSPIATGSGTVKTAHGVLPVPAPATARLLTGVPLRESDETGELTTPTGAAIAAELSEGFCAMPAMTLTAVGSGAGTREGRLTPNILRIFLGNDEAAGTPDEVTVIEASIDDMTGEALAYAGEVLLSAGALDVFTTPIYMKKGRPGHLVTVLAAPGDEKGLIRILFEETTTFGARTRRSRRAVLERHVMEIEGPLGTFRVKTGSWEGQLVSVTPEYEDARRIAAECSMPLRRAYEILIEAGRRFIEKGHDTQKVR